VLYERDVPAREIYHFGDKFLNGYTPQKMQTVRGYFDRVFEGNYAKGIPEGKKAAIVSETDERYTEETGQPPNREALLWKTLRNIETSERFPDLWDQFTADLSGYGISKTVVSEPRDPRDNVLSNPTDAGPNVPEHTGHGRLETVDTESKGFDLDAAPRGPSDTAHREQEKPAVTNVFESTESELNTSFGELRNPAYPPGVKDFEQVNGKIIRNPELQIIKPGQKALPLEKGKKYIWAVDSDGNLRIGVETEVGLGQRLGHPTLTEDGKARVGGEIKFNEETKEWRVNDQSGRYSRGRSNTKRNHILDNVQELFARSGLDINVKHLPIK
jgi:hypothetical protein